jgi:OOP family OmpA-OmpF porin
LLKSQNLVPNPSFELLNTCPVNDNFSNIQNWFSPTTASPDIFDTCSVDVANEIGVPQNFAGYQNALDGSAYAGVDSYDTADSYREYIEIKLTSSLIINTKYFVTFYVSLSDTSREAIDQMGSCFSIDTIKRNDSAPFNNAPQISNSNFNYLNSKANWMKVSGSFIADSAYNFITIGNFKDSAHTHVMYAPGGSLGWETSYYYIDNVCVSTDSLACNSFVDIEEYKNNGVSIFPNPANESFTIKLNEPTSLVLYNNTGVKIIEQKLPIGSNVINTLSYTSNIYFIELKTNHSQVIRQKIIINH